MPAAQSDSNHTLLFPPEWRKSLREETETIIIEGPFGPNIGIYSWLCHYLSRLLHEKPFKGMISNGEKIGELLHRPVQLPKGRRICLFVDPTATFRSQSLWHYLKSSVLEEDKQVQLFLYGARAVPHEVLKNLFDMSVEETYSYDDTMKIASTKLKGYSIISKS